MADIGKTVIVAALDGTFQRKGFPNILELVPLAEHVVKLTAVCMNCFGEAAYTKRISEDKEVSTRTRENAVSSKVVILSRLSFIPGRGDWRSGEVHGCV